MNDAYGGGGGGIQYVNDLGSNNNNAQQVADKVLTGLKNGVTGVFQGVTGTASMMKYMPLIIVGVIAVLVMKK